MEDVERQKVPYAERKLSELVDFACEQLYPTSGFKLELAGITPSLLIQKELEAFSGVQLDRAVGAIITLAYNEEAQQLVLESLEHPLDKQSSAYFMLHRTSNPIDGLRYIPSLEFSTGSLNPKTSEKHKPLNNDDIERILAGYGIYDIPHPSHDLYRFWRADLLSDCKSSWRVSEEVELFVDMDEHQTETIRVSAKQTYEESGDINSVRQISKIYNIIDGSGTYSHDIESSIIQLSDPFGQVVHLRNTSTQKELQPFVLGDAGVIVAEESESIPFNLESFNGFKRLLEDTSHYLRTTADD